MQLELENVLLAARTQPEAFGWDRLATTVPFIGRRATDGKDSSTGRSANSLGGTVG
jgi:hypothetical protein